MQNQYNLAHRGDDAFIDQLAKDGVAYVPFFPLGGFTPLQSSELSEVATAAGATPMQVALAWLLQRAPNILLIPGTSSLGHLRENLAAARAEAAELRDDRAGSDWRPYCVAIEAAKSPGLRPGSFSQKSNLFAIPSQAMACRRRQEAKDRND